MKYKILLVFGIVAIGCGLLSATGVIGDESGEPLTIKNQVAADDEISSSVVVDADLSGICDVCNIKFHGRGYTETSQGVWEETQSPYQSFICSRTCGAKHTEHWNDVLGKGGEVRDADPCSLCGGSGVEINTSSMSSEYGRVCPQCEGKGYQTY